MKTKIYNNLLFSLLFVCSFCGLFYILPSNAQTPTETPPTTQNTATGEVPKAKPITLHLYSTIFGEKTLETSNTDREAINRMIQRIFGRFFSIIFTISGILMVILIAVHGTKMIYAEFGGNVANFIDAKGKVKAAAFGTAVLLLSWIILNFIDPNLLRPKLFETIIGLQEVGQGPLSFADNLEIPEDAIQTNDEGNILTIKQCPEIADERFREQVEQVRASLQHYTGYIDPKFAYQILYSRHSDNKVYLYNTKGQDSEYIRSDSGPAKNSLILCNLPEDPNKSIATITLPDDAEKIVVFPILYIEVKEDSDKEAIPRKFWRGMPWTKKPKTGTDQCISLGKNNINASVSVRNISNDDVLFVPKLTFSRVSHGNIYSSGVIEAGYHIDPKDVKYCENEDDACRSYKSAANKGKIEFVVNSDTERRISINNTNIQSFQVTPIINSKKGLGQCKGPLRGNTICFSVHWAKNENEGDILYDIKKSGNCVDSSTPLDAANTEESIKACVKENLDHSVSTSPGTVKNSNYFDTTIIGSVGFNEFNKNEGCRIKLGDNYVGYLIKGIPERINNDRSVAAGSNPTDPSRFGTVHGIFSGLKVNNGIHEDKEVVEMHKDITGFSVTPLVHYWSSGKNKFIKIPLTPTCFSVTLEGGITPAIVKTGCQN